MYDKLTLVGNLGGDPDMRYMPDGTAVTNFSVACNRTWKNKDGEPQTQVVWYKVAVWRGQAEACNQYLSKGSKVLVDGQLNPDTYGNPRIWTTNAGEPAASYEVTANNVRFLDSKGDSNVEESQQEAQSKADIPF